ncbi:MAG TPA: fimbria/pilus outer membrane usher protein, partial [Burkholderiales bacterium]|nr:fimbria/pilus outer membrane usher protein [Burkholderiales bacterium]
IGAPVEPAIRYQAGATLSLTQSGWGAASLGYQTVAPFDGEKRDTYTVGISPYLPDGRTSLLLTAAHSTGAFSDTVVSLSLYYTFGPGRDYRASAQTTQRDQGHVETLTFEKVRPIGEGLGFILRGESARLGAFDSTVFEPSFIYNAPAVSFGARRFQSGGDGGPSFTEATLSGSIVGVGGEVKLGRAVSDSFAIARVGDVPGARVYYNAQDMGRTDERGRVVISELNSFLENQISFRPEDVPLNYTFRQNQIVISPPFRSGTMVDFGLRKVRPAVGFMELESGGKRVPVASVLVQLASEGQVYEVATAVDGGFYVDDLAPGVYRLSFEFQGSHCETRVTVQETSAELLDLGRISCAP